MKIRKAKKEDISKILKLDKQANKEITWWEPLTLTDLKSLMKKKNRIYIAEQGSEMIGYLLGDIKDNCIVLEDVYVKKNFRSKKIADKLIKEFIRDWKKSKFKVMSLDCPERLKSFYEKFGFKKKMIIMTRKLK